MEEIIQALNLAQAELRAMYKRQGIDGSNILDLVDKAYDKANEINDDLSDMACKFELMKLKQNN